MRELPRAGGGKALLGIPPLAAASSALCVLYLLLLAGASNAAAAYDVDLWAKILDQHTRSVDDLAGTRVDYAALRDSADLRALVASLERSDPQQLRSPDEKLAFWINAYNILAIDLVTRSYPVKGIKEIGSWLRPVWKIEVGRIGGRGYSLDAIEHGILRPLGDPRIHAAVVCASTSCPPLRREPYRPERLDSQLDDNVARWLADPRKGLRIDYQRKRVHLSRIFDWFAEDFESAGGALGFAVEYVPEKERQWLERYGAEAKITWLDYDWSLNDLARARSSRKGDSIMSKIKLAATQMACSWDRTENLNKAEALVRDAAARGAQIIQLQELFETPYFCQQQKLEYFGLATPLDENPAVRRFREVARELEVVLPICFFERAGNVYFNSVAVIDADGEVMGIYRKTHIPHSPGYCEKYYFSPGDTGPRVWRTRYASIGIGICWDQWFPELARAMALMGAEIVLYPTAIGSVPGAEGLDLCPHWQRSMQGHAASNLMTVVASNRVGVEEIDGSEITWFGSSFITDGQGEKIAEAGRESEEVIVAEIQLDLIRMLRNGLPFFRDRRPEMYGPLLTMTG